MSSALSELLSRIGDASLPALTVLPRAALILASAWLLVRLARRASAAVRHGIWAVALFGVVLLPVATHWLPTLPVSVPALRAPTVGGAVPSEASLPAQVGDGVLVEMPSAAAPARTGSESPSVPVAGIDEGFWKRWDIPWSALVLVWGLGTSLLLLRLVIQLARVRELRANAGLQPGRPIEQRVGALVRQLGIRRPVLVLESSTISMPLTWGAFHPVLLLPEKAADWPEARLRVVLLHELAHIRRWDYVTQLVGELACALYWPLPFVWLARGRVRSEQEQACDDLVLTAGTAPVDYAEHLLAVARAFHGSRWELGATVAMAREVSLKQRIRTILDAQTNRGPLRSASGLLALLLLTSISLPVAALRPRESAVDDGGAPLRVPPSRADSDSPIPASSPPAPRQADSVPAPRAVWIEAEEGIARAPMEVRSDLDASSGAYVAVPDGRGNDAPDGGPGAMSYALEVSYSGEYVIWGRVIGGRGNDNSLYISMDSGAEVRWDIADERGELVRTWKWIPVGAGGATPGRAEPMRFRLSAGSHTLRIRNREDGTRLDRLLITSDPSHVPAGRGPLVGRRPTYQWMGVERARLAGAIDRGIDEQTSGAQYVTFGRGEAKSAGTATFSLDVREPGRYVVWGRVLAPDDGANSLFVSVDGGAEVIWDAPDRESGRRAGRWSWAPLNAREREGRAEDPLLLDLRPGRHVIRLRTREVGTRLNGILVTNDASFRPQGVWPAALPTRPVRIGLEAESARLEAPLLVRRDAAAAGGRYVEAERTSARRDEPAPTARGSAVLRFTVAQAGLYTLWGRTRARNGGEDSFWVRVNGGRWIRWNAIPRSDAWHWSMVHDADRQREVVQFLLRPGQNSIEIAAREGGSTLDRLLVTNDPLFRPDASTTQ